jgi:Rrf2 family protein
MFISRECDYAIRIIRALAGGEKKTVDEICHKEKVSTQFSYKILKKLEKKGLVRVYRGVQGGYTLTKSTDDITLYDVFIAMEDHFVLTACLLQDFNCPMNRGEAPCGVHREFERIQSLMVAAMKEKSLSALVADEVS